MQQQKEQTFKGEVLRIAAVLGLLYLMIFGVTKIFSKKQFANIADTQPNRQVIENLVYNKQQKLGKSNLDIDHVRCWNQLRSKEELCMGYYLEYDKAKASTNFKKKLREEIGQYNGDYQKTWNTIYGSIYSRNPSTIKHLADSLANVGRLNEMSKTQLARAVVSFVQDIPYWYILSNSRCSNNKDKSFPCIDDIEFGLLTPLETAYTAIGDCDSKSLLLYSLFRQMGYRPMVLISNQYAHAMLALDIPSTGEAISYKGRRYYFWETTATGWLSGMLPPSSSNVNYWKIALPPDFGTTKNLFNKL